jgi:uncharacterized membrane protein YeaQ/YmgE (transglycosylase-associated protein family)
MALISWLVVGVAVALPAHRLLPGHSLGGVAGSVVAGVLGALLAGLIFGVGTGQAIGAFSITSLVVAAAGAVTVIVLFRLAPGTPSRRISHNS